MFSGDYTPPHQQLQFIKGLHMCRVCVYTHALQGWILCVIISMCVRYRHQQKHQEHSLLKTSRDVIMWRQQQKRNVTAAPLGTDRSTQGHVLCTVLAVQVMRRMFNSVATVKVPLCLCSDCGHEGTSGSCFMKPVSNYSLSMSICKCPWKTKGLIYCN